MKEEFNPAKHCCHNWDKDFCECVKNSVKAGRDRRVNGTLNALKKNKIPYTLTSIENVVRVALPNKAEILLSLKTTRSSEGSTLFKFRMAGQAQWQTALKDKFINRVKDLQRETT